MIAYGAEALSVSVKVTGWLTPPTLTWTVKVPAVEPATSSGLVAVPAVSV